MSGRRRRGAHAVATPNNGQLAWRGAAPSIITSVGAGSHASRKLRLACGNHSGTARLPSLIHPGSEIGEHGRETVGRLPPALVPQLSYQ